MGRRSSPSLAVALVLLALASGTEAAGTELAIRLRPADLAGKISCGALTLELSSLSEAGEGSPRRPIPVEVGKETRVEVPDGSWQVSLKAASCWAPEQKALVGPGAPTRMTVTVWPVAEVVGRLALPRGSELPRALRLTFSSSFANPTAREPNGFVPCPVERDRTFRCRPPAAKLDLRISAEGFAPEYWWEVRTRAGEPLDLGAVSLVPGAALAGWLLTEDGVPPKPKQVRVTVVPLGLADAESLSDQILRRFALSEARPEANGFFQVDSLKAGEYLLAVTGEGFAEVRMRISLVEGRESNLQDPVLLASPLKVTFLLDPPSTPEGGSWTLSLARLHESGSYADTVLEADIPVDGWYEAKGLNPGPHLMKVLSPRGDSVLARQIRLGEEPSPIVVEIGLVVVEGRVTLGDEDLPGATIWFGGRWGAEKVQAVSDDEGSYRVTLPRAGAWPVDVESRDPSVVRRWRAVAVPEPEGGKAVEVDLELPGTRVFGLVRDLGGRSPAQRTIVYVYSGSSRAAASAPADEAGHFDFRGLDDGTLYLHAATAGARSKTLTVSLTEDAEQEVTLTLEPSLEVRGAVVGESGPIPGAFVQFQPAHQAFLPIPVVRADGGGRFAVEMPAATRSAFATVYLPGRTLGVFQVPVVEGQEVVLRLPADGGTLNLQLPEGTDLQEQGWLLFFLRNGIPFAVHEVMHWAGLHPEVKQPEERRIIPGLVEGHYEACLIPVDEYIPWVLGNRDPKRCASGLLPALGELDLALPKPGGI